MCLQAEDAERREKNLEEAKKITIEEDASLPKPIRVRLYLSFKPILDWLNSLPIHYILEGPISILGMSGYVI